MKLFILFTLLICFTTTFAQDAACNYNGVNVLNYGCSCYSKYYGVNCANTTSSENCTINTPSKLKVDFYPTLVPGDGLAFNGDSLNIRIRLPVVNNRNESQVSIQNSENSYCNFPGSSTTQEYISESPCYNVIRFAIPWDSQGYNCSWEVTKTDTEEFHNGIVYINQKESLGTIGGELIQRNIKTAIPIQIKFVNVITFTATLTHLTNAIVDSAITKLEYVKGPPKTGIIEFFTSMEYPHLINSTVPMTVTSTNPGLIFAVSELTNYNNCAASGFCNQRFRVEITLTNQTTTCTFTGKHNITFEFGCHASTTDCYSSTGSILLDVNSEDFCSTTNVNIGLSSVLTSYKDENLLIPGTQFYTDSFVYLGIVLSANVQIVSQTLRRFQWTGANTTKVLYDNSTISADGISESFIGNGTRVGFNLISSHMSEVPNGAQITMSVTILVQYKASPAGDIMQSMETVQMYMTTPDEGTQNTKATTIVRFNGPGFVSNGNQTSLGLLVIIFALIGLLF